MAQTSKYEMPKAYEPGKVEQKWKGVKGKAE